MFFLLIWLAGITALDFYLRPTIKAVACSKAQVVATEAIGEAVMNVIKNTNVDYSDLVKVEKADNGLISAITTNVINTNLLKSEIDMQIQENLLRKEKRKFYIPLGTLIGMETFSGSGPDIPVHFSINGHASSEFVSNFSEAGINQTKHQINLCVHTKANAVVPGYPTCINVDTNIAIAETIIVGKVPEIFANAKVV